MCFVAPRTSGPQNPQTTAGLPRAVAPAGATPQPALAPLPERTVPERTVPERTVPERTVPERSAQVGLKTPAARGALTPVVTPPVLSRADVQGLAEETPPLLAAWNHQKPDTALSLVERGAVLDHSDPNVLDAMFQAIENGDLTPLYYAATVGDEKLMRKLLLQPGANPNVTFAKRSLLEHVLDRVEQSSTGIDVGLYLLTRVAHVDAKAAATLLPWAAKSGNLFPLVICAKHLTPEQLDACDAQGKTPLYYAATQGGDSEVVQFLLRQCGADPDKTFDGRWLFDHVLAAGQVASASTLIEHKLQARHARVVFAGIKAENSTCMEVFMIAKNHVNKQDAYGHTPLHRAAQMNDVDAVNACIAFESDVSRSGRYGRTPLHHAAKHGATEAVHALVEAGARTDAVDIWNCSPLSLAAFNGHRNTVIALLDGGASPDAVRGESTSPLQAAVLKYERSRRLWGHSTSQVEPKMAYCKRFR